jgi:hypothetical protein
MQSSARFIFDLGVRSELGALLRSAPFFRGFYKGAANAFTTRCRFYIPPFQIGYASRFAAIDDIANG